MKSMLVMQLTLERFLAAMKQQYPTYTHEGLILIWKLYEEDEETMPDDEDILINPVTVNQTFRELTIQNFVKEVFYPRFINEVVETSVELKNEIQDYLGIAQFVGFTSDNTVVFRR